MTFKQGVSIAGLRPEALAGMFIADSVFNNIQVSLVITSACDGSHSPGSLHYVGLAFDIRSRNLENLLDSTVRTLREALGAEFDVVVEEDHIHIEFQPKERL